MLQVTKPSVSAAVKKKAQQAALHEQQVLDQQLHGNILPPIITGNEIPAVPCRNCVGCGYVYSLQKYDEKDQCGFCSRPLSMKSKKENRRRREQGEDEQELIKSEALRDRLVAYDRESAARTKVTDDDQA